MVNESLDTKRGFIYMFTFKLITINNRKFQFYHKGLSTPEADIVVITVAEKKMQEGKM